jgi:hypothetical protein
LDIARAIIAVLQAPAEAIHNEVFNVGDTISREFRMIQKSLACLTFSRNFASQLP